MAKPYSLDLRERVLKDCHPVLHVSRIFYYHRSVGDYGRVKA